MCMYSTSWKSAIIEGAVLVLCPVEVLSRRQTQHQHKHMAYTEDTAAQHGSPEPAARSLCGSAPVPDIQYAHTTTNNQPYQKTALSKIVSGKKKS